MKKVEEAQEILKALGVPQAQQNEMSALTLIALCGLKENDSWGDSTNESLTVSKGIMAFINNNYDKSYAPNTREPFRRQVLHQFVQARIVDYNPDNRYLPVNSPKAHYAITKEVLEVIQSYGTEQWEEKKNKFISDFGTLSEAYGQQRIELQIPLILKDGKELRLSAGKHNEVQKAIIEEFVPRFAKDGLLVYLGDTAQKNLYLDDELVKKLNIPIDQHSKLPDVVIYDEARNWLFLIEAVTSHGPMSPKRILELEQFLNSCPAGKVYVSAFPDFSEFKRHTSNIAWETEVWIVEAPDHMIHFNGDRFMGPR